MLPIEEHQQAQLGRRIVESEAYGIEEPMNLNKNFSCVSFGGPKPIKDENNLSGPPIQSSEQDEDYFESGLATPPRVVIEEEDDT